ncbi:M24 family metallopeptidase [Colwelliaceae bacterium BS250]
MNTNGIGGSTAAIELAKLTNMTTDINKISGAEYQQRIAKAQALMQANNIAATYIDAGTNLYYFTGTRWYASERMVGAIIPAVGEIEYIAPHFEISTLEQFMVIKGKVNAWQEHVSPYQVFVDALTALGITAGNIAIDESTAFFIANGIAEVGSQFTLVNAKPVTAGCRMVKTADEIALLQRAKDMTLEVHKAVARILHVGISTKDVEAFINEAHKCVGAAAGSYFCIVLFGEDSAYPHGVANPNPLALNDIVLIDTGCQLEGYNSDITRTYVYGTASERQTEIWNYEKQAQALAFAAAELGKPCSVTDQAVRDYLPTVGLGQDYAIPGLPHRTGHGIGLDIHEWPYLVLNDQTPLAVGMCFSNEPMICVPGEFGIRHEDHFYMTDNGPKWFTKPAHSISDPFGYNA